jgi:hypothetical protein
MQAAMQKSSTKKMVWAGRVMSGLMVAFLLFDSVIHMARIAPVVAAFAQLGLPLDFAVPLGIVELACVAIYVYPRSAVLGAILLTGYLGGAVAMQLRVGNPLFGEALFPIYIGVLLWGGLWLREARLRALIPVQLEGTPPSKKMLWAGRVVSALPVLGILFGAVVKLLVLAPVVEGFREAGFPDYLVPVVGTIEFVCTVVYVIPRTRVLGAILLAGLMGGATATNLRVGNPTYFATVTLGMLAWAGLFLRDKHLRVLIPVRRSAEDPRR